MSFWNDTPDLIDATGAGTEQGGAGSVQTDSLFSYYKVTVTDAVIIDGEFVHRPDSIRRVDTVRNNQYIYSHEMNHADGVRRMFVVTVEVVDIHGRSSKPVSIGCYNPAPPSIT